MTKKQRIFVAALSLLAFFPSYFTGLLATSCQATTSIEFPCPEIDKIIEYPIAWPGPVRGETHELAFDPNGEAVV